MELIKIKDDRKALYMDLLLIADEDVRVIEKYLSRGEMFALRDDDLKALCVVTEEGPGVYEIKNFVTVPKYQRQGYGQRLISLIADHYKHLGKELYVDTGDSPATLLFYEKCGFQKSHTVKNFFRDHYDHPIFEDGKQLADMIYLKRSL